MLSDFFIRALLLLGGFACVGCEMWGTYDFLWEKYGRWNYLVVGGLVLTSLAALLPVGAEYAHRKGQRALKWGAWLAVPVAVSFVFTVSIQRTGTATDNDENQRKQIAQAIKIAKAEQREAEDQLVVDKAAVTKNCNVWGPICTQAKAAQTATEAKLAGARAVLKRQGVEVDDSLAKRLVAYLPFLTKEQVSLYQPLLLPLGLAIIGSLLIAIGVRGQPKKQVDHHQLDHAAEKPAQSPSTQPTHEILAPVPRTLSVSPRPKLVPQQRAIAPPTAPTEIELDPKPVVAFMKRRLPPVRGADADLGDVYRGFLEDWHAQELEGEPLTAAQFGLVLNYICRQVGIRIERRGKRVVCVDRQLVA
jgi:hypothetical protein